tara:strand:+ start:90 stop:524 length:435 start_codon:yes stop_codon:yes gene_type:complete
LFAAMKIIITFVSTLILAFSVNAATLSNVTVSGQAYDITYLDSVTFNAQQTTIDDAPWWNSGSLAQTWATAANTADLRFAYEEQTFGGTEYNLYKTTAGTSLNDASTNSGNYAVSAVAVPAPLPILGILPVVGFLKRMRKRQRA